MVAESDSVPDNGCLQRADFLCGLGRAGIVRASFEYVITAAAFHRRSRGFEMKPGLQPLVIYLVVSA